MAIWNSAFELTPAGSESPSLGDDRFRELKSGVRERVQKEHTMDLGSGLADEDGWHRSGSAKAYFQPTAPTVRPDGSTALTAADNGRLWVSSVDFKTRTYYHAGGATSADRWILEGDAFPVGVTVPFFGEAASVPTGWLLANGQAVSRTDYAALHAIAKDVGGTNAYGWGAGDGSTTFNVPDLREVAIVGVGTKASGVTAHDVFNLAQFKDDQFQGFGITLRVWSAVDGVAYARGSAGSGSSGDPNVGAGVVSDGTNGTPRKGTVTRGKRTGMNYIIKARTADPNYTSESANIDARLTNLEGSAFTFKNKIINGNFDFWQRGTSGIASTAGTPSIYLADRFKIDMAGTSAYTTYSRVEFTNGQTDVPGNPRYFLRSACANGGDATNGIHRMLHYIEDVRTLAGEVATLSFWAKADAVKNLSIEIVQTFGSGGSPSANVNTYVTKIALTTSWVKYSIPLSVPSISGKTIGTDGAHTSTLLVTFWMSAGSTYASRTGTLGIQAGTFDFAKVQMESGTTSTAFEERPPQVELALCQRYYEKSYNIDTPPATASVPGLAYTTGGSDSGGNVVVTVPFCVTKRKTPAMAGYNYSTGAGTWEYARNGASGTFTPMFTNVSAHGGYGYGAIGSVWAIGMVSGHWTADAEF